jgi:hypothetical protein
MPSITEAHVAQLRRLFAGFDEAFGVGAGRWVKRPPSDADFAAHLRGEGTGIGISPLRRDSTVWFASIDLDEPDYNAAQTMTGLLPGTQFIERSRSGNYHVHTFFDEPIPAWIPRALLKHAADGAGKPRAEIFPKAVQLKPSMLGSYINLPYFGEARPCFHPIDHYELTLDDFLPLALKTVNDPAEWIRRADRYGIEEPKQEYRERGTRRGLHACAAHIIANAESNPLQPGGRNVVLFALAKMLFDSGDFDAEEVRTYVDQVNDAATDPLSAGEIDRICASVERGGYSSTSCDDPLMAPYILPDCPIAHPRKSEPTGGLSY